MKHIFKQLICLTALLSLGCGTGLKHDDNSDIRQPAVAGQFYPADAERLTRALDYYLEDARPVGAVRPIAIIAPHAGYIYSGQIAADAFNQAAGYDYDVIVILGTNHTTAGFDGVSIFDGDGYRTPLGVAPIDRALVKALLKVDKDFTFRKSVHTREHSIEVQIPFIQRLFPGIKIVPAVIGWPDPDLCTHFGKALTNVLQGRQALIVASSDLSHYPGYEDAVAVDQTTLHAIQSLDPFEFQSTIDRQIRRGISGLSTCACGAAPIMTAMVTARELGAGQVEIISYANSGDALVGDRSRVVGYGAVTFLTEKNLKDNSVTRGPNTELPPRELNSEDRQILLAFARQSIQQLLASETVPLPRDFTAALERKQGAFVTLSKNGELRGCIGHMGTDLPVCQVVGAMAIQAAVNDRRFHPLSITELPEIEIEISLLTLFKSIAQTEDFVPGRDGIVLKKDGHSAVYLPQVAPEQGWNRQQTLDELCRKAGLPQGSWKKDAQLFTFQAEVFCESDFK
ncbi:MAG: AmmeMemoRadiSam system protein B [Candidatus Marinimicrobia bacterium]|nr:AmmeMemoRadiSam system protein B [Candidatus Neomarinimicrobiota bacterium]MBL7046211.1 AmmeMemoRadiSam system protein B [Candidatus Neomarinimicrobiota bacterium]